MEALPPAPSRLGICSPMRALESSADGLCSSHVMAVCMPTSITLVAESRSYNIPLRSMKPILRQPLASPY